MSRQDYSERIAASDLPARLRAHIDDRSTAYGSVRGALDNYASACRSAERPSLSELRDAIHAGYREATDIADEFGELVRELMRRDYQVEHP